MKLVILDTFASASNDLTYDHFSTLAELTTYERTSYEQEAHRIGGAELVITNKCVIDKAVLDQCPNLKYIGATATGYNNIDIKEAANRGIVVTNVPAYSTKAVAQQCFAYILAHYSKVMAHNDRVKQGEWEACADFCFYDSEMMELDGKVLGLIGFGSIAQRMACLARAFDMKVVCYTRTVREQYQTDFPEVSFLPLETLLRQSDILSIHCPLTEQTRGLINTSCLTLMKPSAILLNTARGPVIEEQDLTDALNHNIIKAAYVDVVSHEPIRPDNPLLKAKNIVITPHTAWAPKETRQRLIDKVYENLECFLSGNPINQVNESKSL